MCGTRPKTEAQYHVLPWHVENQEGLRGLTASSPPHSDLTDEVPCPKNPPYHGTKHSSCLSWGACHRSHKPVRCSSGNQGPPALWIRQSLPHQPLLVLSAPSTTPWLACRVLVPGLAATVISRCTKPAVIKLLSPGPVSRVWSHHNPSAGIPPSPTEGRRQRLQQNVHF